MKKKLIVIGIIFVEIGGAACCFFNRKEALFDAPEGMCPRCLSHDVRRWEYGLGVPDTEEVIGGGCVIYSDSPKYHCDVCGFNWGVYATLKEEDEKLRLDAIELAKKHFSGK